ncbi:potassium channel family protein [Tautonia plasticadhaerens]|uniref:Voltage-gated potassium channel Kch n=1 Tax=Tautonia plasticadhaerens TaxID=2527974 RepID=A0A518GUY5_9BACT|nr:NAD-binding protein [Tautonia plasticadhaerens]QDV32397.1 Voltage-gated potassium channel Kch [Tautonia plasticadhaerens]
MSDPGGSGGDRPGAIEGRNGFRRRAPGEPAWTWAAGPRPRDRLGRLWLWARVYARYARFLLWEFRWSLSIFWTLVVGGGWILHRTYHHDGQTLEFAEACYGIFLLIFVEGFLEFPDEWYLQLAFFLVPVVGLGAVADSLVRLGYLVFTRKGNLPEWHRMVASVYREHVIVVGLGTVGYQIVKELLQLRELVAVVERPHVESELIEEMLDRDVPIVRGDARSPKTLEAAGVARAKAVVLATQDDLANLDAALTARDLNPRARIVMRMFDESLAEKVGGSFSLPAVSTAKVAAPAFVAAATGRNVYQDFQLAGRHVHLVDLTIERGGGLVGRTVGEIQADRQVNIVMHHGGGETNVNPDHDLVLGPGDEILAIAPIDRLVALERLNRPREGHPGPPVPDPPPLPPEVLP